MRVPNRRHRIAAGAASLLLVLTACGSTGDEGTGTTDPGSTTERPATTPTPTQPSVSVVPDLDDPYGVLAVEWPTTLGYAARLLDRLPTSLGDEERTPVVASNNWFLIGNIPILANADDSGRVLAGYFTDGVERVAIAQPAESPLGLLWGYFIWGGAPDHCVDVEAPEALLDGDRFDESALQAADAAGTPVWLGCTMQQNPDSGNEVEAPDDWAYGFGWTTPGMAWFVAASSLEGRDELIAELIAASKSDAPPSDPGNPIFDVLGPAEWWPGGVLMNCAYSDMGDGLIRFDPVTRDQTVLFESRCDQASLSPDGTRVVVDEYALGDDVIRLVIRDLDGGNPQVLTDPPVGDAPADGDMRAVWSPTGEWIAFERAGHQIHVIHPDGSGLRFVTDGGTLSWSADGTTLLVRGGDDAVAIRLSDGTERFTIPGARAASWSPDGTTIAYEREGQLHLWSPELGDLGPVAGLESLGEIMNPTWSPDGNWVLLDSSAFGTVIVDPEDGTIHGLGPRPGDDGYTFTVWAAA